jgi:glycosyltransferase involved in cell wall biosynthesis
MPRIAIVVPCYNDGATLREALETAMQQEPHELVVVDDGSTDEATLRLFQELEHEGIRVAHQENQGPSAARMHGTRLTSAPYVFALDADDKLAPHSLTALADALDADPEAVAAWGDEEYFGEYQVPVRPGEHIDPWLITYTNTLPIASLYRRTALVEVGGWDLGGDYEDWDLWMKFAERGYRGVKVHALTLYYRVHGNRGFQDARSRHGEILAKLRARHPELYDARPRNRATTTAPRRARALFPLIDRLPFDAHLRQRLYDAVRDPVSIVRLRIARLRA